MNNLDTIRAFAGLQTSQNTTACSNPIKNGEPYLAALNALAQSNEWLQDQALTELVASKLETIEPQSIEARAQTAAIYMKLINPKSLQKPIRLNTVQIKISKQETVDLPKTMLMAESPVLQRLLSKTPDQPIDLTGKASLKSLTHLTSHLATGQTDFVTDENAVELLLLAKEFELNELAMKCLERLLDPDGNAVDQSDGGRPVTDAENKLRDLLKETRSSSITIARSEEGTAYIKMMDGSKKEQWQSLRKFHAYIPITHLELTKSKNLDCLLDFSKHNPDIVSLNLDESPNITDAYLEDLSQNLPKLRSFSICCAPIKAIPQALCDRATMLNCYDCRVLKAISANNVVMLACGYCDSLTTINAPSAMTLKFHNCRALTSLQADNAVTIGCGVCHSLTSVSAPKAISVVCLHCPALKSISAPEAVAIDCQNCRALTSLHTPNATTLDCSNCETLASLSAPKALKINSDFCLALKSISADEALTLSCNRCDALANISAPNAITLYCTDCRTLESVNAPSAATLYCRGCPALKNISAPNATTLDLFACRILTSAVRLKLFNIVRRNIILTYYRNPELLIDHLSEHFKNAKTTYALNAAVTDFPLESWFIEAQQLSIPADFDSENDKRECEQTITGFYERLSTYVANKSNFERLITNEANKSTFQSVDLSWFNELRKLDSPQQQMSRLIWLGCLLACTTPGENPLADRVAVRTLKAIGNLGDPFLQEGATRVLFSMYDSEASDRKNAWIALREKRSDHQQLLCLFFAHASINLDKANQLMDGLNTRYYRDFKVLGPILEMASLLSSGHSMTALECEEMLRLVLKAPEKGLRENAKRFAQKVEKYRAEQPTWVNACRDLLFFRRASELKNLKESIDLQNRHKKTCQAVFGVKEELLHAFVDTFKSQRYPNGLFTYTARLQTLPESEKALLTELLGKFVNGVLDGGFPDNRYDLSNNEHLKTIFEDNPALFKKWKEPLEIAVEQTENGRRDPEISPCDIIHDLMRRAIANKHLGADQARLYPRLVAIIESKDTEEVCKNISLLENHLKDTRGLLQTTDGENRAHLKEELSHLEIETLCLQAIDPRVGPAERAEILNTLRAKLPEGIEFRNDVSGMLDVLKPSKTSTAKWVKIQTCDSWEDFLLMGTEVNNSCQRIDGDPNLNKCLLAYILDGKNELMIVRDSNGKIAARSVLRILWNEKEKRPVLFMEQIYTAKADPALQRLIMDGCVEKAKRMELPLVASKSSFSTGAPYTEQLSALGGPAPFEYVDALSGIQLDGMFTLASSNIIYTPDAKPVT